MRTATILVILLLGTAGSVADEPTVTTSRPRARRLALPLGEDVFHFVIFGDRTGGPAGGIAVLKDAVREANLLDPDLVMTVGDLVQGYNQANAWLTQMEEYRGVMADLRMPWYPVAGNHDVMWRGSPPPKGHHERDFEEHFGPLWYAFRHKNAAFVALYSDEGDRARNVKGWGDARVNRMSGEQLAWLETTLAQVADLDHVFVFLHHPKWRADYYKGSNWDDVHALLKRAGNVSAVFAGHMHRRLYSGTRDGIAYYTLAAVGAGMPFSIPGTGHLHHMDVVTVRPDSFRVATIPIGSVLDPTEMTPERHEEIDALRAAAASRRCPRADPGRGRHGRDGHATRGQSRPAADRGDGDARRRRSPLVDRARPRPRARASGREPGLRVPPAARRRGRPGRAAHPAVGRPDGYVSAQGRQGTLPTDTWVHLAGVYDGQEVRLYVDGRLVARAAGSGVRRTNAHALLVGADPDARGRPTSGIAGLVDEVRLSSTARYGGETFTPALRHEPDADTVLLLHLDGRLGPFAPDHAPGRHHALHARRVECEPLQVGR